MRHVLFAAALLLFPGCSVWVAQAMPDATAPAPAPVALDSATPRCSLLIHATGFRNRKGLAEAAIFASPDGWPERQDKTIASDGVPIAGSEATLSVNLPPGKYGVVVLDDENENQKLDRNFLGIPTEGFGFANNPRVLLIAPSFAQATVPVTCPMTTIDVKIIYK